jgi:hypothetical protein
MSSTDDALPRWSTWCEIPAVVTHRRYLKRTVTIALCVGTVFFAMNQLEAILADQATPLTWLKVAITYLTPFCMSNFGIITATRTPKEGRLPSHV